VLALTLDLTKAILHTVVKFGKIYPVCCRFVVISAPDVRQPLS
jgi:hypothetical protein